MQAHKAMPMVQKFMTTLPKTIGKDQDISTALTMMREFRIRHLPVQDGGKLIGVITDRDIKLASSFKEKLTVEEVMTPEPYTTSPDAPLNQVAYEMAEHKYGCAVIQQGNQKVVGILTATDALRILGEILDEHYKAPAN